MIDTAPDRTTLAAGDATKGRASDDSLSPAGVSRHTAMARLADMLTSFENWLVEWGEDPARWIAFDQLVRNRLSQTVGAERVRCFRVVCGGEALESLVPAQGKLHALVPARQGVLGDVLSHGRTYRRLDGPNDGAARPPADGANEAVCWCFPILERTERLGVVSVGRLRDEWALDPNLLEVVGRTVSLMWNRLSEREKLSVARQTDEGTGVLTRGNFFRAAEEALAEGYANWEPAVVVVLVVEGIRHLDDNGLWEQRDSLLTAVGKAIRAKVRSDDVLGRFADDRFVALLRRLEPSLGQMITHKLLEKVRSALTECACEAARLRVRCGLASAGEDRPTLRQLVSASFAAAERARLGGLDLVFASNVEPATPIVGADSTGHDR